MFKAHFVIILFPFIFLCQSYGQQAHCFQDEYFKEAVGADPALLENVLAAKQFIYTQSDLKTTEDEIYIIPVVVHILYHTDGENISDERIFSQINVLNEDYMRLNADTAETPDAFKSLAANCNIQFCLASFDPAGDTTSGIIRTFTERDSFTTSDNAIKKTSLGGADPWDPNNYLNIWVCNLPSNILGFSSLPGFPDDADGVTINYRNIGFGGGSVAPYNLGRTTTHEIGHYLGLTHVWGDDGGNCDNDDGIGDTPLQAGETYGCPDFPLLDECSPDYPGVLFMNYMDYTNDGCMNVFTENQKLVMRNTLETVRSTLLLSAAGCNEIVPTPGAIAALNVNPNPADNAFIVSIKNFKGTEMVITIYNALGQLVVQKTEEPAYLVNEYFALPGLPRGYYFVSAFNGIYRLSTQFMIY